ncbi:tRNA (adenosine(37)-N6)-threonylcarbamoyltransferase complex dimerization subunit type 1 TsaB [Butyrivibrio sp. VCB2001]|uniref:tRNA (adenosine(37)-N6)-threonylcarbamoyltransferase complex dimerization subunit type 1 TsaB n=1 Tax=Butyrivibrio sp. VCB2001 TaxID=1280667 RepID=UPI00041461BA|nr:tRNA (adenosine(37)-N6)-threonylcarbamoyltransferase complex dimerization subunit type 1 TsaB [Butyrivibrio sp. VCB2001]
MKILAIDTSGLVATVAITDGDLLKAQFSIQHKTTHSEILMPMLKDMTDKIGLDLSTIDAIAVAKGPGSFTGLRIGSATAKGLALALDKPIIPIPTVDGLAYNLYGNEKIICPMMDARRSQVYTGIYTFVPSPTEEKNFEQGFDMRVIKKQYASSVDDVIAELNSIGKSIVLLGDGVPVYHDKLEQGLKVPFTVAPLHMNRQSAASIAALALKYAADGRFVTSDEFAPDYLRLSQAERESLEKEGSDSTKASEKRAAAHSTPGKVRIRPMTAEDVEDAWKLEQINLGKEAWTQKQLLDAMTRDDTIYLVAEMAGRIVGLCGVQNISGEGEVTNVSVSGDVRREGCGYKMVKQLLERGKGIGIRDYTLEVRAQNAPAIRLYEKLGFKSEGVRPGFYEDPKDDAVIYWKREEN